MMCDLSFQTKEARSSLKRRLDGRLSRTSSTEREPAGETEGKKESDENKENWRLDEYLSDQDSWNESVISGRSADSRRAVQLSLNDYLPLNVQQASKIWAPCQWIKKQHNLC